MNLNDIDFRNNDIKRQIIMDHYSKPIYKSLKKNKNAIVGRKNNLSCMDDIIISLVLEKNILVSCCFDGIACSLAISSTDIIIDLVIGKSMNYAKKIIKSYEKMILTGDIDDTINLTEALVFCDARKHPNRLKCTLMGPTLLFELISKNEKN